MHTRLQIKQQRFAGSHRGVFKSCAHPAFRFYRIPSNFVILRILADLITEKPFAGKGHARRAVKRVFPVQAKIDLDRRAVPLHGMIQQLNVVEASLRHGEFILRRLILQKAHTRHILKRQLLRFLRLCGAIDHGCSRHIVCVRILRQISTIRLIMLYIENTARSGSIPRICSINRQRSRRKQGQR